VRLERLVIFVKAPRPGTVKTRLAQALGGEGACAAYQRLVATLLSGLRELPEVELAYTPADARSEVAPWLGPGWQAHPQEEGDLGLRLQSAFSKAFRAGVHRVVVIGSDCPAVTAADIRGAWKALLAHDLVIGPATDGGYWLIGLRRPHPALFYDMPWSTDRVFAETLRRAEACRLRAHVLRERSDVDTVEQWDQFRGCPTPG
jgi:uncharacterized protein